MSRMDFRGFCYKINYITIVVEILECWELEILPLSKKNRKFGRFLIRKNCFPEKIPNGS